MCTTCGCSDGQQITLNGEQLAAATFVVAETAMPEPPKEQGIEVSKPEGNEIIHLEADLLAKNQQLADINREYFKANDILVLNLLGSPGAGKTTLLEKTLADLVPDRNCAVIEGDQATAHDADRIRSTGAAAVQINTGPGCHLEADMVSAAVVELSLEHEAFLFIENVGNLVCPALFDLGEAKRVVLLSITEGEDKPIKYPHMFRSADLLLLHKTDLLPHLQFDVDRCIAYAKEVNPKITVIQLSSTTGEGMPEWRDWLAKQHAEQKNTDSREVA